MAGRIPLRQVVREQMTAYSDQFIQIENKIRGHMLDMPRQMGNVVIIWRLKSTLCTMF